MTEKLEDTEKCDLTSAASAASTPSSREGLDLCILVEGPRWGDAETYGEWLLKAAEANGHLESLRNDEHYSNKISSLELVHQIDLGIMATVFVSQFADKSYSTFLIDANSEDVNEFCIMARVGFFQLTEGRYQMCIPEKLDADDLKQAVSDLAATEDDDWVHPENFLTTMTYASARDWQRRLNAMDEDLRLANRDLLLAEAMIGQA